MADRAEISHPQPSASWETRGWWEGAGRNEIVLQHCPLCGVYQHKPRALCVACLGSEVNYVVASGLGTVHTYTVTYQNQAKGFAEACPYVMAYVELDEGPRVLTNIVGCDPETVSIGMRVQADFAHADRDDGEAFAVPRFTPVSGS
ncbi:MAG: Zn-ribbon domain-containing OB-fold protein [Actinomycetota bacterium]